MDRSKWSSPEKLRNVVFGYDLLRRYLTVFASEVEAITAIEGLEVAEGDYKFFSCDGSPLEAQFSVPVKINFDSNTYSNGVYTLKPTTKGKNLMAFLRIVECDDPANSGLATLRDIEQFLIDKALGE